MNEKICKVYSTRIEIEPYELGDLPQIENMTSIWDPSTYQKIPYGYCHTDNKIIIPRGISLMLLQKLTGRPPTICYNTDKPVNMKYRYHMKCEPRDQYQQQAINFLLSKNGFENGKKYSQLSLNLATGFGKTYCATNAMLQEGVRTIIITHKEGIKEQWIETFAEKTDILPERVINISGSKDIEDIVNGEDDYDIFLVNHATISSYARKNGWDAVADFFDRAGFGLKIIDEVHLCFTNTIYIDFFSNVRRNYYLTATFERSDKKETQLFKRVFANTLTFGGDLERRKHTIYNFILFNSNPSYSDQMSIRTMRGVSSYLYADYAFKKDEDHSIMIALMKVMEECMRVEGKTLVVVPKIENIEMLMDVFTRKYPDKKVGAIYSKKSKKENELVKAESDIIISTIKGMGTGSDIAKLRNLVIMEPHSSKITSTQLIGRLREYASDKDTYAYELVDIGFSSIMNQVSMRLPTVRKKCKEVHRKMVY